MTLAPTTLPNDPAPLIAEAAEALAPSLVALRRDLHAHPELAFQEHRTAATIAASLAAAGIPHQTGIGRTGIVATIRGARPGPTIVVRGDMDALPITEQTGLPYASENPGLMHACGHDIHTATLLGTARILHRLAPTLAGEVRLLFQPAEEILGGAAAMIADDALEGVVAALGYHNHPEIPVGQFAAVPGATYAACDRFDLTLHGRSGHAAYPHAAIDPIVAAAHLIAALQTVVSREINPRDPCVITIGAVHAGTIHNIIPDTATLLGTVRTLSTHARAQAEAAIRRHVAAHAAAHRITPDLIWREGVPPTINDGRILEIATKAVEAQLGEVWVDAEPTMGAEDFAEIAARVPSFVLRIGSGAPGRADALHNSNYQPDERCIPLGAQALARAAIELLAAA